MQGGGGVCLENPIGLKKTSKTLWPLLDFT